MFKKINKKIQNRIGEFCYYELKKVFPKRGNGVFNQKCFHNAVDYAKSHKNCKVVMGIYSEKGTEEYHLHFWVRKDSKDLEVSIGYQCEHYKYYELKIIPEIDYDVIEGIFSDGLAYYKEKLTTPYERFWVTGRVL